MKKTPPYATEADLCADFLAWVERTAPDVRCYAEWEGWDILLAYPEGWQIGIEAKLRLNANVILQAAPDRWNDGSELGPDFRAVLVPSRRDGMVELASRLGLIVFWQTHPAYPGRRPWPAEFGPDLRDRYGADHGKPPREWLDWNPGQRHGLPPVPTDAIAGSPCPVSLTPWKLGALAVLAELEVGGTITTKRIRVIGVDPRRWTQQRWLEPAETRGDWIRGARCPRFDEQHPTAYRLALEKARGSHP